MNYVRNTWYVAGWSCDLAPQKPLHIDILDEPVVIFRSESGRLVCLEDRCVHRLAPLSLGRCEGNNLRCMYHGFLYNPEGQVIEIPGQDQIPAKAKIRSYPIVDRHSWLWVWMGDPAKADETLIPPAIGYENPDYIFGHDYLDYEAEAQLICDNLLDFSHLTFVHAKSFGAGRDFASTLPRITQIQRGIRYERWIQNTKGMNVNQQDEPVDLWLGYDFLIPGILLMKNGMFPAGTAETCNYQQPDFDMAIGGVTHTSQAVTPTTKRKARYFFNLGTHRKFGCNADHDNLMHLAMQAFYEDKLIIEAQDKVMANTVEPRFLPSGHDRGVTLFNRLVEKMVAVEVQGDICVVTVG